MEPGDHQHEPIRRLSVHAASAFRATCGANAGDALGRASDLVAGDIYTMNPAARTAVLALARSGGTFAIARGSEVGTPGHTLNLDCVASLMDEDAHVTEVLVLEEVTARGDTVGIHILPLAPIAPRNDYALLGVDVTAAAQRLAQLACVSFTRGTEITLGTGKQRAVEHLRPGDPVLTRDDGVQPLRWIGHCTQRAVGAFAPVRIAAGALNNSRDLRVSPDHRLFFYQRRDRLGAGRAGVMVRARDLVNGQDVTFDEGGFVEYHQLLFDNHQIIYAEGIAVESMIADESTAPLKDGPLLADFGSWPARHRELGALEVRKALIDRPDAVELLKRASRE